MALPPSGPISLSQVNVELSRPATQNINMNEPAVRALAEVPTGPISMSNFYGKSSTVTINLNYTTNTANLNINLPSLSGYVAGKTKVIIDIGQDIYIYSTSTANAGLTISGGVPGDEVLVNNHGFIIGAGGKGGNGAYVPNTAGSYPGQPGGVGGLALNMTCPIGMNNFNLIAGGGGGGGSGNGAAGKGTLYTNSMGGGGGGGGQSFGGAGSGGTVQQNGGEPCIAGNPGGAGTLTGVGGGGGGASGAGATASPGAAGGIRGNAGNPAPGSNGGAAGPAITKNGNTLSLFIPGIILGSVS